MKSPLFSIKERFYDLHYMCHPSPSARAFSSKHARRSDIFSPGADSFAAKKNAESLYGARHRYRQLVSSLSEQRIFDGVRRDALDADGSMGVHYEMMLSPVDQQGTRACMMVREGGAVRCRAGRRGM